MAKTDNLTDFLTDLADGIRTAEGSTGTINPQNFRSRIEGLTQANYQDGYSAGVAETLNDLCANKDIAPIIIQESRTPHSTDSNGLPLYHYTLTYNKYGYDYTDFFTYEASVGSTSCTINVINNTKLKMIVEVSAECDWFDGEDYQNESYETTFTVAPQSSNSGDLTCSDLDGSEYSWSYYVFLVRFYL